MVSILDAGLQRLRPLALAMGAGERLTAIEDVFRNLVLPWGLAELTPEPLWLSDIGDDHTPFEFSIALEDVPELRLLVEILDPNAPTLGSNARVTRDVLERMAPEHGLDLTRLDRVWDLFVPPTPTGSFSLWLGAMFSGTRRPGFKVYLNPDATGSLPMTAPATIAEALERLDMGAFWPMLGRSIGRRGRFLDEFKYLSLDLANTEAARVKVYARHREVSRRELLEAVSHVSWYPPSDLDAFLERIAPGLDVYDRRGIQTCFSFVSGEEEPNQVTTHFPINSYAPNDAIVRERVLSCLEAFDLPRAPYEQAIEAFRNRPLEARGGMHSYVSLKVQRGGARRLTIYLPAELYRPGAVAHLGPTPAVTRGAEVLEAYRARRPITAHPLAVRSRRAASPEPLLEFLTPLRRAFHAVRRDAPPDLENPRLKALVSRESSDASMRLGNAWVLGAYHQQLVGLVEQLGLEVPPAERLDDAMARIEKPIAAAGEGASSIWEGAEQAANAVDACLDDLYGAQFETKVDQP